MRGKILLPKIEIRNMTPVTPFGDYVERKKELNIAILAKISNMDYWMD